MVRYVAMWLDGLISKYEDILRCLHMLKLTPFFILIESIGNVYNGLRLLCKQITIDMKCFCYAKYITKLKCPFSYDTLRIPKSIANVFLGKIQLSKSKSHKPFPYITEYLLTKKFMKNSMSYTFRKYRSKVNVTQKDLLRSNSATCLLRINGKEIVSSSEQYIGFRN